MDMRGEALEPAWQALSVPPEDQAVVHTTEVSPDACVWGQPRALAVVVATARRRPACAAPTVQCLLRIRLR